MSGICCACAAGIHTLHSSTNCDCRDPEHDRQRQLAADMKKAPRRAKRHDPITSHAAASAQYGKSEREERIWQALHHMGSKGGTGYDIARAVGLTQVQVMRSMSVLEKKLWVKPTGRTAPGDTGYDCQVYTSTYPARELRLAAQSTT